MKRGWGALLFALAACGGSDGDDTTDRDGGVETGIDARVPPGDAGPLYTFTPPPPVVPVDCASSEKSSFSGVITALTGRTPIVGAQVCVLGHSEIPCATTNATGFYELTCAPVGEAAITFTASGFATGMWLWRGEAGEPGNLSLSLVRDAENTSYLAPTGVTYPDGTSSLVTVGLYGEVAGMRAILRSGTGAGPFWSGGNGGYVDPEAEAAAGENELGFFVARSNVEWDEVQIELVPPAGKSCAQENGMWQGAAPSLIRVPVRAGWESVVWIRCQ